MTLSQKVARDLDAVKNELKSRGFSEHQASDFIDKISMKQCYSILDGIERGAVSISWKRAKRISRIASWCASYDRMRIFYWLRRRNIVTQEQLDEMAGIFSEKFDERCPKVINSSLKRQATRDTIRSIEASS